MDLFLSHLFRMEQFSHGSFSFNVLTHRISPIVEGEIARATIFLV